jgi:hypothetical protein
MPTDQGTHDVRQRDSQREVLVSIEMDAVHSAG